MPWPPNTNLESLLLGNVKALGDDTRVQTLRDIALGLLKELADEQDVGRGAIASDLILSRGGAGNHRRCGVLDLLHEKEKGRRRDIKSSKKKRALATAEYHLTQEDLAVLGGLDVT